MKLDRDTILHCAKVCAKPTSIYVGQVSSTRLEAWKECADAIRALEGAAVCEVVAPAMDAKRIDLLKTIRQFAEKGGARFPCFDLEDFMAEVHEAMRAPPSAIGATADAKDAARYRWLRGGKIDEGVRVGDKELTRMQANSIYCEAALDDVVDAAMDGGAHG